MKKLLNYSLLFLCCVVLACHKDPPPTPPATIFYNVTATADSGVTISPSGVTKVEAGKSITYTITAAPSKRFKIFLNGTAATGFLTGNYSYQVTNVNSDQNLQVTSEVLTFTVTSSAGTGGTITPTTTTVNYGSDLTLTITENAEYTLTSIKVNGVSMAITKPYILKNITANSDVVVGFTLTNFLTLSNGADNKSRAWMWTHWDRYDSSHVFEYSYALLQSQLTNKDYYYTNGKAESIDVTGTVVGSGSWGMLPGNVFTSGSQTYTVIELTDKKFVYDQLGEFTQGRIEIMRMTFERQ